MALPNHILGILLLPLLLACTERPEADDPQPDELLVFAAASLRDAMTEVGAAYEAQPESSRLHFNFGASNTLAQQLIASPRADAFVSANEAWMDRAEQASVLAPGSRRVLLSNRLVLIAPRNSTVRVDHPCGLLDSDFEYLVLGNPEAVPAGVYARQHLASVDCPGHGNAWAALSPKVLPMPDVRAALAQVERRRRVVGFTYRTDAATSSRVRVLYEVRGPTAPRITYPAALTRGRDGAPQRRFMDFLQGPVATSIFTRHGFLMAAGGA